jgi:hypothetical protein
VAREIQAALVRHAIDAKKIEAFNRLDAAPMTELIRRLMQHWAIAVGGRFSYATVAAYAIEAVRRAAAQEAPIDPAAPAEAGSTTSPASRG